jgi:AraC-like DNA-binding protein/ligand-binding sensor protein
MAGIDLQKDFVSLANSKEFEEFSHVLIKLTGLAMALNSPEGTCCNMLGGHQNNKICMMIRNSKQGLQKCFECDQRHYRKAINSGESLIYSCHAGFWDIAVPIFVQGRHIATISSGQVLSSPVSEKGFQALRQKLDWLEITEARLRKTYETAPYLPKKKLRYVIRLLEMFAFQLCESLHHIRELEKKLEKEEVRKAKEYIHQRYGDPMLCLADVAKHVGFSRAHFSHMFKCATGISFTMFLQNCRIEAAKHDLLYTQKSITEICFNCGFNSLTHFNRIFRGVEHQSPSQYRKKLV